VIFAGFRANAKDYFQCFDLFVSASRREPLGRVMVEALDAGTPVIATATDGAREILSCVPSGIDLVSDFDALVARLRHHHQRRTGRVQADLSAWHIDVVAAATLDAYRTLLQARNARP
jgi:glycosyltransferase involved in cell wall biosynthesis